ncbi:MAG: Omp28 family outer membrane lipoprotein [Muribaculaceae bacterium]|nr:Omp28 family outer membrane lipoprotein [Muribaculaceae bacterium]
MNILKYNIPVALAAVMFGLASCDNIAEDDRFVDYDRPTVERKIVIFEFTGQRCRNCPAGAAAGHSILENNPDDVFAINLHPENTQYTLPLGNLKLTSPAATFLYQYYQPSAFPAACINGGQPINNTFTWSSEVSTALSMSSPATLNLTTEYNAETRELTVNYNSKFNEYTTKEVLVQLYLLEDGIVGMQQSSTGLIRDYVHNHVLRTTLYNDWGNSLGDYFEVEQEVSGTASITLSEDWDASECTVVGCLISAGDKSFLQAAGADVVTDSNNE